MTACRTGARCRASSMAWCGEGVGALVGGACVAQPVALWGVGDLGLQASAMVPVV